MYIYIYINIYIYIHIYTYCVYIYMFAAPSSATVVARLEFKLTVICRIMVISKKNASSSRLVPDLFHCFIGGWYWRQIKDFRNSIHRTRFFDIRFVFSSIFYIIRTEKDRIWRDFNYVLLAILSFDVHPECLCIDVIRLYLYIVLSKFQEDCLPRLPPPSALTPSPFLTPLFSTSNLSPGYLKYLCQKKKISWPAFDSSVAIPSFPSHLYVRTHCHRRSQTPIVREHLLVHAFFGR